MGICFISFLLSFCFLSFCFALRWSFRFKTVLLHSADSVHTLSHTHVPPPAGTWAVSISGLFAYQYTKYPHLSLSQKVIHARVYAQGITIAAVMGTALFGMFDRKKIDSAPIATRTAA